MSNVSKFKKRLCANPKDPKLGWSGPKGCPDIWELENGDIAIIGKKSTELLNNLPQGASCNDDETLVILPRKAWDSVKNNN